MSKSVQAMVQTGPRAMELRTLPWPTVGDDEALIRVEACGICGSDLDMYDLDQPGYPLIRGHEPVGIVEEIGTTKAKRHGLKVGDRVAVDPFIRCGTCQYCLAGLGNLCRGTGTGINALSMIPLSVEPGLWGGFATHLFATSQMVLYPVPADVPAVRATLFNALGAGVSWAVDAAGTRIGSTVAILGCGQRGLTCAVAALEAGAATVAITGLTKDSYKLALAEELGVHLTIDVEKQNLAQVIYGALGSGVDAVVDTTPFAPQSIADAVTIVRPAGRIISAGMKARPADGIPIDTVTMNEITIKGVRGVRADQYQRAIAMIARSEIPLHRLQTHVFGLKDVEKAIKVLGGEVPGENPINIVISNDV